MANLSLLRNATREWAESMRRFEKAFELVQRLGKRMLEEGASQAEVTETMNEALRGHPDLQARVRDFTARLEARQEQ